MGGIKGCKKEIPQEKDQIKTTQPAVADTPLIILDVDIERIFGALKNDIERFFDEPRERQAKTSALAILASARRHISRGNTKHARSLLRNLQRIASDKSADNLVSSVQELIDRL